MEHNIIQMIAEAQKRLGENVHLMRTLRGMSQLKLAAAAGIQLKQVHKFESGSSNAQIPTIIRVAFGLGVDTSSLFQLYPCHCTFPLNAFQPAFDRITPQDQFMIISFLREKLPHADLSGYEENSPLI